MPVIISVLVRNLRLGREESLAMDYGLVVLLTFCSSVSASTVQQVLWMGARVGLRAKIALSAAVYVKTLRLSNVALLQTSAGQVCALPSH